MAALDGEYLAEARAAFFAHAIESEALRFGDFVLKSGRRSRYFFNLGQMASGQALSCLGAGFALLLGEARRGGDLGDFDVLFGPPYKGIALAALTASALDAQGMNCAFAYSRKEKKQHGEGGSLVGADLAGKRVVIIDDVLTAGTAILQARRDVLASGGQLSGIVVAFDRQERPSDHVAEETSPCALQLVSDTCGAPALALANYSQLLAWLENTPQHRDLFKALSGV